MTREQQERHLIHHVITRLPGPLAVVIFALGIVLAGCSSEKISDEAMTMLVVPVASRSEVDKESYTVILDDVTNGSITVSPEIESGQTYPAGTVFTVTAAPASGYEFDSGYIVVPGRWGTMYIESMTPMFTFELTQDLNMGASFIEASVLEGFSVIQDIVYAQPGVKPLKYDVYTPDGADALPVLVIIHGGGWSSNSEDIMRGLAREIVRTDRYVVASIDYRWIGNLDGDVQENTVADLIADVFGGLAHIQEHAVSYGGDPSRIVITGDSAGGHLTASAINMVTMIGDDGFGTSAGIFEYMPSYVPDGMSVDQVRESLTEAIKAAAPSYAIFGEDDIASRVKTDNADMLAAISPITNIPQASERAVPQYVLLGTRDELISDEMVSPYVAALGMAGQTVEYVQIQGARHGFFDWKPDSATKATFERFGVPYAAEIVAFFDQFVGQ